MFTTNKHINKFILTFALALSFKANAQEVRVIDNKGTIQNVNNNRVFTQATDPNPTLPTPPITVQGDIWFNSSVTPNEMNVWNGTSWVTVTTQNNAWLRANSTDTPTDINDNIYTNGRIGINDDNPDYAIKVVTVGEGIDRFLRFETNDSNDYLEVSNTTSSGSTLSGGFIGGTLQTNRAALNFFGDTEISDDNTTSQPIIKFFARRGSNNANITPNPYGGGAGAVTNRPLFDFINGNVDSKLRILANGNTGIDVDTPTEKLDINGTLRVRTLNNATANDNIVTATTNGVLNNSKINFGGRWTNQETTTNLNVDNTSIAIFENLDYADDGTTLYEATSTTTLEVKETGRYDIRVNISLLRTDNNNSRTNVIAQIFVGNTAVSSIAASGYIRQAGNHDQTSIHLNEILQLTAGNIISIRTFQEAGNQSVTFSGANESSFIINKLR